MENENTIFGHTVKKACCQDKPLVQTVFLHLLSGLSAFQYFHNSCSIDKLMINNLYFLFPSLLKHSNVHGQELIALCSLVTSPVSIPHLPLQYQICARTVEEPPSDSFNL